MTYFLLVVLLEKPITSVMFSDVDEKNIDRAVRAYKNKEKFQNWIE
jgi:hypothetical protein